MAEWISEDAPTRARLRRLFAEKAVIHSTVVKKNEEAGAKFRDYFDWREEARKAPGHRLLAMFRGEDEKALRLTVRPDAAVPGWREACLTALAVAVTLGLVVSGVLALRSEAGSAYGFAAEEYFLLAVMAGIGPIGDIRLYRRGGLVGRERLARHLWRMCLGLFIAAGSLFTGPGERAFPFALRESGLLSLPELLIALTMLFWLVKLRLGSRRAAAPKALGEQ
jgi:hypothetical protein